MNHKKAIELIKNNEHLIGQKYKGATIDELIIVPIDEKEFASFAKLYLRTLNSDSAIQPFLHSNLKVIAIFDKNKIDENGIFLWTELESLSDKNLNVII